MAVLQYRLIDVLLFVWNYYDYKWYKSESALRSFGSFILYYSCLYHYILNHIISYLYSTGVVLGISMIGVIIAAFCETSLGDRVWFLIPWSWLLRISDILFNQQKIGVTQLFVMVIISLVLFFFHKYVFQNWNQERLSDG